MVYPFVEDARYVREWVDGLFTLLRIGAARRAGSPRTAIRPIAAGDLEKVVVDFDQV